jgi:hypothetical protein
MYRTADNLTGSMKELTVHLCYTETVGLAQWKVDICLTPGSGDHGASGLLQYRHDTVTARR